MARTTTEHTIVIDSANPHGLKVDSAVGTASKIYPGALLEKTAGGVRLHGTAGGYSAALVALPHKTPNTDTYAGSAVLQTPYAKGETVYFARCTKGDLVMIRIKASESTTDGQTFLESDGSGHVQSVGTDLAGGTSNPVALAWETVATAGSAALVKALVL